MQTKKNSVIESLVMVKLTIRYVTGAAKAHQVIKDAEEKYSAQDGAVRASMSMIVKKWRCPLSQSISKMRKLFYEKTLPWDNSTWRVVPTTQYQNLMDTMSRQRDITTEIHKNMIAHYEEIKSLSKEHLGALFDEATFPTKQKLDKGFSIDIEQGAVASPDDARLVGLDEVARKKIKNEMQQKFEVKIQSGAKSLVDRLQELIADTNDRIGREDQAGVRYATLIDKIGKVCECVDSLNVLKNKDITDAVVLIKEDLGKWNPKAIRDLPLIREEMKKSANTIEEKLSEIHV